MVMQSGRRVYTVEEIKNLPPPSPELIEQRRRALEELEAIGERIMTRLGRPFTEAEIDEFLGHGEDDDEFEWLDLGPDLSDAPR